MDFLSKIILEIFGKNVSGGYSILFLIFIISCIAFLIWAIYFATTKKALLELTSISWLSLTDTAKYTTITVISIIVFSAIFFVYDFGIDKVVNVIIQNAK